MNELKAAREKLRNEVKAAEEKLREEFYKPWAIVVDSDWNGVASADAMLHEPGEGGGWGARVHLRAVSGSGPGAAVDALLAVWRKATKPQREQVDALNARLKEAEYHLREIARTADTLSPQEFINHAAAGLGVDRHEYAGAMDPNRSIVELTRERDELRRAVERLGVKP